MEHQEEAPEEIEVIEMLPIATEVFTLTEQRPGHYVSLLNDEFFAERQVRDPNRYLKAMLLIAREKLMREIGSCDRARTIETALHKNFKSTVFSASFLLDEEMNLILLTYFGEQTPVETNYAEALVHVLEVFSILENDLGDGPGTPGQRTAAEVAVARAQGSH